MEPVDGVHSNGVVCGRGYGLKAVLYVRFPDISGLSLVSMLPLRWMPFLPEPVGIGPVWTVFIVEPYSFHFVIMDLLVPH